MIILYTMNRGQNADDIANGSITIGWLKEMIRNADDDDTIIINTGDYFAEIDDSYDEY